MSRCRYREGMILVTVFLAAVGLSVAWERAERQEVLRLLEGRRPGIPRIRIGQRVPPGWPVALQQRMQGIPPDRRPIAVSFVTPTCPPCRFLLSRLSQASAAPSSIHLIVVVAGWSPLESMQSYCQRRLGWIARHATVLPDDDARLTKRLLGANPRLPTTVCVDAAGIVRGIESGLSEHTMDRVQAALKKPLSARPVPVPTAFLRAELIGEGGKPVSAGNLIAADLTILVRVSARCAACDTRVEDLGLLTGPIGRRVFFVASERPPLAPYHLGGVLTFNQRNAQAVRSVFPAEFVPQCVVFRRGEIVLREETPWGPEEMARFLSWCALQS